MPTQRCSAGGAQKWTFRQLCHCRALALYCKQTVLSWLLLHPNFRIFRCIGSGSRNLLLLSFGVFSTGTCLSRRSSRAFALQMSPPGLLLRSALLYGFDATGYLYWSLQLCM